MGNNFYGHKVHLVYNKFAIFRADISCVSKLETVSILQQFQTVTNTKTLFYHFHSEKPGLELQIRGGRVILCSVIPLILSESKILAY